MSQSEVKETSKWDYIRRISEYGAANNMDAVLKLLEWYDRPNTLSITKAQAQDFLAMLQRGEIEPGNLRL